MNDPANPDTVPAPDPDDELLRLMAWADGALSPAEAAAVEAAVERDPVLAARAAAMQQSRDWARAAFEARLADDPVPDRLRMAVERMAETDRTRRKPVASASVPDPRPLSSAPTEASLFGRLQQWLSGIALPAAVAASVTFGGLGYFIGKAGAPEAAPGSPGTIAAATAPDRPADPVAALAAVGAQANDALARLLDSVASGDEAQLGDAPLVMVASYRDRQQRLCRDYSVKAGADLRVESVACRTDDGGWQIAWSALASDDDAGFGTAQSGSALEAWLAGIGAGQPLDPEAERDALKQR